MDIRETLTLFDQLIKKGQGRKVRKAIKIFMQKHKIPRKHIVDFANIARRVQLPHMALKMLNPIVRSKTPITPSVNNEELACYASCLSRIGAHGEAEKILNTINTKFNPEVLLYISFNYFFAWEYKKALPFLKKYRKSKNISKYQKTVCEVNLAASYIAEGSLDQAKELLETLLKSTKDSPLLHGNTLELCAQLYIHKNEYEKAKDSLLKAQNKLKNTQGLQSFYVKKWHAINQLLNSSIKTPSLVTRVLEVKKEAENRRNWETLRECDLYIAKATNDIELFNTLYFGTSFSKYKMKIKNFMPKKFKIYKDYMFCKESYKRVFDIQIGQELNSNIKLNPGGLLHKLFWVLVQDFYRPFRVGYLHAQIYPDEFYDSATSPDKISQLISRLRSWFLNYDLPLKIIVNYGVVQLKIISPYAICLTKNSSLPEPLTTQVQRLKKEFQHKSFRQIEAALKLQISPRSCADLLKMAQNEKLIAKQGYGKGSHYRTI